MLVASACVAFILHGREVGTGFSALAWVATLLAAGLAASRSPARGLMALVFLLPVAPYVRYDTWLGKDLPSVITAAVLVGVALSPDAQWNQLLRDRRRSVATPLLAFAALLAVSVVLVLLQRSPFVATLTGAGWAGGYFASDWVELRPQSTGPILRGGMFLLGPVAGLAFLSFLTTARDDGHQLVTREGILAAFLLTTALNLGVACGQVFVPDFPVPTLYETVSGLFHNPIGLALLMTLAAPVALAVSLRPTRISWLRPLAVVTVVLVALMFVPIQQRSAHLGVAVGVACLLAGSGLLFARRDKNSFRRVIGLTVAVAVLLIVGLAGAFARTTQWQQVRTAIIDAPLSAAWLGIGLRQETNRMAFFMVGDRPLGGYGVGGFEAALPAYYDRYGPLVQRYDHSLLNHPLHMAVDLGVFGLLANLWLLGAFLVPPLRTVFVRPGPKDSEAEVDPTAVGCVAGAVAALFLSIWTAEWLYDAPISVAAFMLLALAAPKLGPVEGDLRGVAVWAILAFPVVHAVAFVLGV